MYTIQEKNGWLFVVKDGGEWYRTIHTAYAYQRAYGNHEGEQVNPDTAVNRWVSLDGLRKYQTVSDEPDFIVPLAEIPNKEIEVVEKPEPKRRGRK